MVEQLTFPLEKGGSIPTSPLQLRYVQVNKSTALEAYSRWHYLGGTEFVSSFNFGVYFENSFLGCISYGPPNATDLEGFWDRTTQKDWFEIKRFALSPDCPRNSESRTIAITIKLLRKKALVKGIVTYADIEQGHEGVIYKASGFTFKKVTSQKKDYWVDGKIQQRGSTKGKDGVWIDRSRKNLFYKILT